jgi:outer membrane lipopolysaccharide assembly protein LptE/RlpB
VSPYVLLLVAMSSMLGGCGLAFSGLLILCPRVATTLLQSDVFPAFILPMEAKWSTRDGEVCQSVTWLMTLIDVSLTDLS